MKTEAYWLHKALFKALFFLTYLSQRRVVSDINKKKEPPEDKPFVNPPPTLSARFRS